MTPWAPFAPGLKTLEDALDIPLAHPARLRARRARGRSGAALGVPDVRRHRRRRDRRRAGWHARGIARHTLKGEFRRVDPTRARVVLVEGTDRVLPPYPQDLSRKRACNSSGSVSRSGSTSGSLQSTRAASRSAPKRLEARTVIWAAGVASSPLGKSLGAPLDRAGRVQVETDLSVPGHPEIFVVGDLAGVAGVRVLLRRKADGASCRPEHHKNSRGQARIPFRYRDYGQLATIGRNAAVAVLGRLHLSGYPAWLTWLVAHIYFLINFRNRLR